MTEGPKPGDEATAAQRQFYIYDAWNRLVEVWRDKNGDGDQDAEPDDEQLAAYEYDSLNRRIKKVDKRGDGADVTYDFYYNVSWQVLEVRRNADTDPYKQYVWDIRYIDAPVVRFRDGSLGTAPDGNIDDTLYYCNDANMNVTALVDASNGNVVERCVYDAYGKVKFYNNSWTSPSDTSGHENEILYCGYRHDDETKLFHVRNRMYHSTLGRWVQRDPIGYADGMSLYEYVRSHPLDGVDPRGLVCNCRKSITGVWSVTISMAGVRQTAEKEVKVDWTVWERDPRYGNFFKLTWTKRLTAKLQGKKWTPCKDGVRTCLCSYSVTFPEEVKKVMFYYQVKKKPWMRASMIVSVPLFGTSVWVGRYTEACCDGEVGGTSGTFREKTVKMYYKDGTVRVVSTRTWIDEKRKPK